VQAFTHRLLGCAASIRAANQGRKRLDFVEDAQIEFVQWEILLSRACGTSRKVSEAVFIVYRVKCLPCNFLLKPLSCRI